MKIDPKFFSKSIVVNTLNQTIWNNFGYSVDALIFIVYFIHLICIDVVFLKVILLMLMNKCVSRIKR